MPHYYLVYSLKVSARRQRKQSCIHKVAFVIKYRSHIYRRGYTDLGTSLRRNYRFKHTNRNGSRFHGLLRIDRSEIREMLSEEVRLD
jgi:hypothetical protein